VSDIDQSLRNRVGDLKRTPQSTKESMSWGAFISEFWNAKYRLLNTQLSNEAMEPTPPA